MTVKIQPNSLAHNLYGNNVAIEEYFCHFGINPLDRDAFIEAGMQISGIKESSLIYKESQCISTVFIAADRATI